MRTAEDRMIWEAGEDPCICQGDPAIYCPPCLDETAVAEADPATPDPGYDDIAFERTA